MSLGALDSNEQGDFISHVLHSSEMPDPVSLRIAILGLFSVTIPSPELVVDSLSIYESVRGSVIRSQEEIDLLTS